MTAKQSVSQFVLIIAGYQGFTIVRPRNERIAKDFIMPRKLLILIHMYIAAFLAPALILVGLSGGFYLSGYGGDMTKTSVTLPADTVLDFRAPELDADVRALLIDLDPGYNFEYIKNRGTLIQTRPTSRTHYEFAMKDGILSASHVKPNFQAVMMELHKGHGPNLFKIYQKFVALGLLLIVLSGLWVGLVSKVYRKKTFATAAGGLLVFLMLGFAL